MADPTDKEQETNAKPAKQQLLLELDMQRQAQDFQEQKRHEYFLCDPYPPSIATLDSLRPILLSELELEKHHRGRVLMCRSVDDGCRIAAVQTVIEDDAGNASRFTYFNGDPALEAEQLIPDDTLFAIKEPFYTTSADCGPCVRVDHPSDLVRLDIRDESISVASLKSALGDDAPPPIKSAQEWKTVGNKAYSSGDYRSAVEAYTRAIRACTPEEESLKRDVFRNRCIVNIYLKRFETAKQDAISAVIPGEIDQIAMALNAKAYYRAGRAAYEIGFYDEARGHFERVKSLTPTDKDALNELAKVELRQREQAQGDYDFAAMSRSSSEKHNRLDHADFCRNVEVKQIKGHGRGLIATKDLSVGDLVMCEKAVYVAFESDREAKRRYAILNRAAERQSAGTQAILQFGLSQKLLHSPKLASQFFDLYDGGYKYRKSPKLVDDVVSVDTFRVGGIIDNNSFACPTVRSSGKAAQRQAEEKGGHHSTGLWRQASYINHACDGNCMRSFMGDMIIIRASRNIAKGEEILMPYLIADPKNEVLQAYLKKNFGFTCDCSICKAEAKSSEEQKKERIEVIDKVNAILSAHPLPLRIQPDRRTVAQVDRLFSRLESTYDSKVFENLPRTGLIVAGQWLCQAHCLAQTPSHDKIIKAALSVLRNMGFIITMEGQGIEINRQHGLAQGTAIEAALSAAHGYKKKGKAHLGTGQQMYDFAKSIYFIMHGELRGFEEMYSTF